MLPAVRQNRPGRPVLPWAGARRLRRRSTDVPTVVDTGGCSAVSPDPATERYRRRRYWPALTIIAVLLVGAVIVWFPSLRPNPENSAACNAPGPAPATTAPTTRSASPEAASPGATDATAAAATPEAPATTAETSAQIATSLGAYADHESLAAVR